MVSVGARARYARPICAAHRRWQHAERQIKRARRRLEAIVKCFGHSPQIIIFPPASPAKVGLVALANPLSGRNLIQCRRYCASKAIASGFTVRTRRTAHVHVHKAGNEAKFCSARCQLSWNKGFREAELREIAPDTRNHEAELIESWNETE